MKIAFSTSGAELNSPLESRFGRSSGFLIYNLEEETFEFVDNGQNLSADQGAGIQAAQSVVRLGVGAVVTGRCGPKASRVLSCAGVRIFSNDGLLTVEEALTQFRQGKLNEFKPGGAS
jgi:predicted Fe-Mo cluster-binding NifX family protein